MKSLLEVRSLGLSFGGGAVLENVSFSVRRGEFIAIIGPNGAGKSTLLKCLGRLQRNFSGSVFIEGTPIGDMSQRAIARKIAWIPQSGTDSLPFTVREFLFLSRYPWKAPYTGINENDREIIDDVLRLTELNDVKNRPVNLLSGGERQKVLLAAALAQTADMLFLDEPASFLDYRHQVEMISLVERVNREQGITVLMVSHDINLAMRSADKIIALKRGKILRLGVRNDFLNTDLLREIFDTEFCLFAGEGISDPYVAPRGMLR